jgi:chemosensory pili system protein ChpA (sensor histidine kinase/response regulator)
MMHEAIDYNALSWVRQEIDVTLRQTRALLLEYSADKARIESLQECAELMHQVRGPLQIAELEGAGLLAAEMETLIAGLPVNDSGRLDRCLELLLQSMQMLPAYLSWLQSSCDDSPDLVLPQVNLLRSAHVAGHVAIAVPGHARQVALPAGVFSGKRDASPADVAARAHAARVQFQSALLAWYRGGPGNKGVQALSVVLDELRETASSESEARLWWVGTGVAEALDAGLLPDTKEIKQLFGQLDRQIKRLVESGQVDFEDEQTDALLESLLNCISGVDHGEGRIATIISTFSSWVGCPDQAGCEADFIYALEPSGNYANGTSSFMDAGPVGQEDAIAGHEHEVGDHLREILRDISLAKEAIDEYLECSGDDGPLQPVIVVLERMCRNLRDAGLVREADVMSSVQAYINSEMLEPGQVPDNDRLERLADAICSIEFYLECLRDGRVFGSRIIELAEASVAALGFPVPEQAGAVASLASQSAEENPGQSSRESAGVACDVAGAVTSLQVVDPDADSEILEIFFEESDAVLLRLRDLVPRLETVSLPGELLEEISRGFHTLKGSGRMLGAHALGEFTSVFENLVNNVLGAGAAADSALTQLLQQACEASAQLLGQIKDISSEPDMDFAALVSAAEKMGRGATVDTTTSNDMRSEAATEKSECSDTQAVCNVASEEFPVLAADADAEIVEIYIEEASEEVTLLADIIPAWISAPENAGPITEIRRSMHTLKGSGRMAGALYMGEFAWAMEDLLNRVIDGTVKPDGELYSLVDRLPSALQQMIDQISHGTVPAENISALMSKAAELCVERVGEPSVGDTEALQAGAPYEAVEEAGIARVDSGLPQQSPLEADSSLLQIYTSECQEIVNTIRVYLDMDAESCMVTEPLYRCLHTLSGISESAGAGCIGRLAAGLDGYFSNLYHMQGQMPSSALDVLRDSSQAVELLLGSIPDKSIDAAPIDELCERIAALHLESEQPVAIEGAGDNELHMDLDDVSQRDDPDTAEDYGGEQAHQEDELSDVDQELFEVFLEEVAEILDSSERVLHTWADEPETREGLVEYQRHLHTLKGSARMMNIAAIGDLSHALETLVTRVAENTVRPSADLFSTLFVAQDTLSEMLEKVRQRHMPESRADLIDGVMQLAQLASGVPNGNDDSGAGKTVEAADDASSTAEYSVAAAEEAAEETVVTEAPEAAADAHEAGSVAGLPEESPLPDESLRVAAERHAFDEQLAAGPATEEPERELQAREACTIPLRSPGEQLPARKHKPARKRGELVKVQSELLDNLVNYAGEINIYRARMETQIGDYRFNLGELEQTINRLREQLRKLEMETEAQVLYRYAQEADRNDQDFDPLELDRYSTLQQSSRSLMESISDLYSLLSLMETTTRDSETLLLQQSRVSTDLQEGLMRTRMTPFAGMETRLRRIVRQSARQLGKKAELELRGADGEMDRAVIERIIAPLEHMLRNSVAHGIESPADRENKGKEETGRITIAFDREGPDIVLQIADDGAGMNVEAIRRKAVEKGLLDPDVDMPDSDMPQFVLQTGFSTACEVTQISGRGVGLDVVNSEVKQLGGSLHIESARDAGTVFTIRLPYTLAINQALLVSAGADTYCVPLGNVEGVVRVHPEELMPAYAADEPVYEYAGNQYQLKHLATLLDSGMQAPEHVTARVPLLLMRIGEKRIALHVEALHGSREIVIKPVGMQLSSIDGISGATILGDGAVVMILDVFALTRSNTRGHAPVMAPVSRDEKRIVVMVVDDSITVRKVTTRLLERNGYKVLTARDGVDATGQLQGCTPDIMLLDIEMPRMDGFELATHMRNDDRLRHVPVIMITSRTGDKHRERARQIGVKHYLGKPYQENDLLGTIDQIIRGAPGSSAMCRAEA